MISPSNPLLVWDATLRNFSIRRQPQLGHPFAPALNILILFMGCSCLPPWVSDIPRPRSASGLLTQPD
ncbi:MAG TPA: hypothetical protein VII49_10215 [Rhizomicrobium sp.]